MDYKTSESIKSLSKNFKGIRIGGLILAAFIGAFAYNTHKRLDNLKRSLVPIKEDVVTANFGSADANDTFYMIDGKKAYVAIDGMPIENYFR